MYITKYLTKIYVCLGSKIPHEQKLMDEIQLLKEKVIALKTSQKTKTRHQSKALNSVATSNVKNSDDEFSEEDEEKLAFLNKKFQRLLKMKKRVKKKFMKKRFSARRKLQASKMF